MLTGINTESDAWSFDIHLLSGTSLVGLPPSATTPWLKFTPDDNRLRLDIQQEVPWFVEAYAIERQSPTGGPYVVIDTVEVPMYVDSNLVNGETYCYRVTTLGAYDDPTVESPLISVSQEACARPFDYTAPCAMVLEVTASCSVERDTLRWFPAPGCDSDDIMGYNIYWAPFLGDSLELWRHLDNSEDTVAIFNEDDALGTIAGCFVVTAVDSLMLGPDGQLRRNESTGLDLSLIHI